MSEKSALGTIGVEKTITRTTCCECFAPRRSLLPSENACWFCKYAWYGLEDNELPQNGVCKYPARQTN